MCKVYIVLFFTVDSSIVEKNLCNMVSTPIETLFYNAKFYLLIANCFSFLIYTQGIQFLVIAVDLFNFNCSISI